MTLLHDDKKRVFRRTRTPLPFHSQNEKAVEEGRVGGEEEARLLTCRAVSDPRIKKLPEPFIDSHYIAARRGARSETPFVI